MAKDKIDTLDEFTPDEVVENPLLVAIHRNFGAPSKYTEDACMRILEVAAEGGHVSAMILAAGAKSRNTFYEWQKEHPEFKEAVEFAKVISQAYWENPTVMRSINATQWAMLMNNKFPDDYRNPSNTSATNTTNINFNTLNLNDDQKRDRIKGLLEKLNSAGKELGNVYDAESEY